MSEARAAFMLALFVGAIVTGAVIRGISDASVVKENPYAQLARVDEPAVTAVVASAILNGDARTLADRLDSTTLSALREALMSPTGAAIADVRNVRFVGATGKGTKILAAYVMTGKDMSGIDAIVGFVLEVENGQIVGVN
jgi:hypothetical protein